MQVARRGQGPTTDGKAVTADARGIHFLDRPRPADKLDDIVLVVLNDRGSSNQSEGQTVVKVLYSSFLHLRLSMRFEGHVT